MKYYCETISADLAKKLKEKGMPIEMQPLYAQEAPNARGIVKAGVGLWCPSYAEVFDWLFYKGIEVEVYLSMTRLDAAKNPVQKIYAWNVYSRHSEANGEEDEMTWHEAADAAIEKALTLI